MAAATSTDFVEHLRRLRLLEPSQFEEVDKSLVSRFPDPRVLAKQLLQRGWLSSYQVNQLIQGRGKELVLGSYILIEKLGEGGMGEVFKARNWKLGTTVALKVMRKERLADKGALQRFQREIRAAAQLTHPNIVRAYDADEVGGTHLLVMEYVEGTDLSKLVRIHGPLPVDQACDFIRQAAAGLQHAFERGMVHRDIKPHNLLLSMVHGAATAGPESESASHDGCTDHGQIKILDMGLARVSQVSDDSNSSSAMTQEGAIMGTPDYIAPEQARDSHTVDIRADLYSLGCTFFYLLTGSVPFPKGSLIQKLARHQFDAPPAVASLKPEVPGHISAIIQKLMAKLPEDRFQSPAELIEALTSENVPSSASLSISQAMASATSARSEAPVPSAAGSNDTDTAALWSSVVTPPIATMTNLASGTAHVPVARAKLWVLAGGGVLLALAAFLFWLIGGGQAGVQEGDAAKAPEGDSAKEIVATVPKTPATVDDGGSKKNGSPTGEKGDHAKEVVASLPKTPPKIDDGDGKKKTAPIGNGKTKEAARITWVSNALFDAWRKRLVAMKPVEQDKAVAAELKKRNPGFNGLVESEIFRGFITRLEFQSDKMLDLSPVRAVPGLKRLSCPASGPGKSQLSDLGPLQGLPLVYLNAEYTMVADLNPLRDLPLEYLYLARTRATDLTPLKGLPLKELRWDFRPERDLDILRSMTTLKQINGQPAAEFWKRFPAVKQ